MYSAGAPKRIMLIHDATQEVPASALRRALHIFSLKPGDKLGLFGVFHLDSNFKRLASTVGKNTVSRSFMDMDVSAKKKQYENSWEIMQVSKLCGTQEVGFSIEVASGPSRKLLAVEAAKKSRATWIILDRKLKKEKTYFLKNLSCGISKLKQQNCIAQIRGPVIYDDGVHTQMASKTPDCAEDDDDLFSIELSPEMPGKGKNSEVTNYRKAKASHPPRPLQKTILPEKGIYQEFTESITVDSIDDHQLQWLIRVMGSDPNRKLSMDKVIPMLKYIFDSKTTSENHLSQQSQIVSDTSKEETRNGAAQEVQISQVLASPYPTNTSGEYDCISYTEAPSRMLKREPSRIKYQISYDEMIL
ncbi:hypothetical protein QQ045_024464 [Rhodiola kirilowii]